MKNLYVVGGMSRVGKSLIAQKLKEKNNRLEVFSTDDFRPNGDNDKAWLNIVNFLNQRESELEVLIEGNAITPEKVRDLKLEKFKIFKVIFLGYGRESHADQILKYAYRTKDWVFREIEAGRYTEQTVRDWMKTGIPESNDIKRRAENIGYDYFDITDFQDFEEYANLVSDRLRLGI